MITIPSLSTSVTHCSLLFILLFMRVLYFSWIGSKFNSKGHRILRKPLFSHSLRSQQNSLLLFSNCPLYQISGSLNSRSTIKWRRGRGKIVFIGLIRASWFYSLLASVSFQSAKWDWEKSSVLSSSFVNRRSSFAAPLNLISILFFSVLSLLKWRMILLWCLHWITSRDSSFISTQNIDKEREITIHSSSVQSIHRSLHSSPIRLPLSQFSPDQYKFLPLGDGVTVLLRWIHS